MGVRSVKIVFNKLFPYLFRTLPSGKCFRSQLFCAKAVVKRREKRKIKDIRFIFII